MTAVRFIIAQLLVVQIIKGGTSLRTLCFIVECLSVFMYVRTRWRMGNGWKREWMSFSHISETTCTTMSERVVRKEMGALFCTIPWYSSNEVSLRVHDSRWAYILIRRTSWRSGSCSCILQYIMSRLISCTSTKILCRTSGSEIQSIIAGCGLLKTISFRVSSIRAVYSLENWVIVRVSRCPNSDHTFSA